MTAALEGGEWSAVHPGRTLPPGKTRYPFYRRVGGPQGWTGRAENLVPSWVRSWTVQPVGSRYTNWATRPTDYKSNLTNCWILPIESKMAIMFSELNSGPLLFVRSALYWFLGQFQNTNKGKRVSTRGATSVSRHSTRSIDEPGHWITPLSQQTYHLVMLTYLEPQWTRSSVLYEAGQLLNISAVHYYEAIPRADKV